MKKCYIIPPDFQEFLKSDVQKVDQDVEQEKFLTSAGGNMNW